jgi:pyrroloquinoline quinone biosynthesis protein B
MPVEAILLGDAQDGGVPQAGCDCPNCIAARKDPGAYRWVACLALVDRAACQSWLIDATPDFREQLHELHEHAPDCSLAGIFLTHAHMGHYAGLIHLGREAMDVQSLPLYVSSRMAGFLRDNGPWSQLIDQGNVRLQVLMAEEEIQLGPHLAVTPLLVPHRDEFSDTLAFLVSGLEQRLFYCRDIDAWDRWERDLRALAAEVDIALLDGTFFSAAELPGRDLTQIPHPLVTDTAGRVTGADCDIRLIHLNHSNPLLQPGPERGWLEAHGIGVGTRGDLWLLG